MLSVSPSLPKKFKRCYSCLSFKGHNTLSLLLQGHISPPHLLQIHARIFRIGADQNDLIATRLIGRHKTQFALRVFHHLHNPNIFPFNSIIRIAAEQGLFTLAFSLFNTLKLRSLSPNDFTFSFLLKACFRSSNSRHVRQIHTHVVKLGFDLNLSVCNGLIAVYAKGVVDGVEDLLAARKVFDEMSERRMICSWTCLIDAYARFGLAEEALLLFVRMIRENLMPEDDTMVSVLSACSNLEVREIEKWVKVFLKYSDDTYDGISGNFHSSIDTILVYLYGKLGNIGKSREVFDKMPVRGRGSRTVLPWNAMISGYAQNGCPIEALGLFRFMLAGSNPKPNHVTMVSVLSACAQVGDLDLGRWIHGYMKSKGRKGVLESNTFLATAFIDMYSKCGCLEKATEVFDSMVNKDVVSFNAMIMGLAINGRGEEALRLFSKMEDFDVNPNDGTFLGALCGCTHSGLVSEGRKLFLEMAGHYSISPKLEHYACFIDLLARLGHLEEAFEVVTTMPIKPNGLVWGALLGGCLAHSRLDLALEVAKRLVDVDPENSAGYVMLSNAYAIDRQWGKIAELRSLMRERGVRKLPGCSWISIDGVIHEFVVGSTSHPQIKTIYQILDVLFNELRSMVH